jgi:hypothetical protein
MTTACALFLGFVGVIGSGLAAEIPHAESGPKALEGGTVVFQSSDHQTALLELYTSEGCSGCPPAEAWLSQLKNLPRLWKDFVPVAFHVDYWDYLGWRDPWATKGFSERQRSYAQPWGSDSVYTPGFVLNGKEWGAGSGLNDGPLASTTRGGMLKVTSPDLSPLASRVLPATFYAGQI